MKPEGIHIRIVMRHIVLFLLVFAAGAARAADSDPATGLDTDLERAPGPVLVLNDDVDFVRRRGVDLYERHQASLVALDAAREVGLSDISPEGWVTLREEGALRVRFVGQCSDGPCGLVDVRIDRERLVAEALYPPAPLAEAELDAWRAKELVFATQEVTCDAPYNAVALPPEEESGPWIVYLVPQPEDAGLVALSGHSRVSVDLVRGVVLKAEDFSASCIMIRRAPEQSQLAIDYGWAPMPAETHVLNSLLHQLVFFVGTLGGVYRVNGNQVERIADIDPGA